MSAYWLRVEDEGGMIFEVTANGGISFGPSYKPEKVLSVLDRTFNAMRALGYYEPTNTESVLFHVHDNLTEEKKDGTI